MSTTILRASNVCEALRAGVRYLLERGLREETRAGTCVVAPGPVVTETLRPVERVLFSAVRDANPFFHLYESVWMLAGRDDGKPLTKFVRTFSGFTETDGKIHGAYGYRWRKALGFDQLDFVVNKLRVDRGSRQCVIQMWDATPNHDMDDPSMDSFKHQKRIGSGDLRGDWRDRPCNTHVYLRVRDDGPVHVDTTSGAVVKEIIDPRAVLDLTVCCRSNDAVWGAHGANAVHFSVLQEYLAARIGVGVGIMYQLSNNYHVYDSEVERLCRRADAAHVGIYTALRDDRYVGLTVTPTTMFSRPESADEDVQTFVGWVDDPDRGSQYANRWFAEVAEPAMAAHAWHKRGEAKLALECAHKIQASDWRVACVEWLERRTK